MYAISNQFEIQNSVSNMRKTTHANKIVQIILSNRWTSNRLSYIYKIIRHFSNCHATILDAQKMSEHFWKYQHLFRTDSWMTENNSQWHPKVAPHCLDAHLLNLKLIEILKLCGKLMEFASAAKELLFRFYSKSFKRNDLTAKWHFDINKKEY